MVNLEKSKILLNWNCRQQSLCICRQVSDCQITPAGIKMFILTQIFPKSLTFSTLLELTFQRTLFHHQWKKYSLYFVTNNILLIYIFFFFVNVKNYEKCQKLAKYDGTPAVICAIIWNPTVMKGVGNHLQRNLSEWLTIFYIYFLDFELESFWDLLEELSFRRVIRAEHKKCSKVHFGNYILYVTALNENLCDVKSIYTTGSQIPSVNPVTQSKAGGTWPIGRRNKI